MLRLVPSKWASSSDRRIVPQVVSLFTATQMTVSQNLMRLRTVWTMRPEMNLKVSLRPSKTRELVRKSRSNTVLLILTHPTAKVSKSLKKLMCSNSKVTMTRSRAYSWQIVLLVLYILSHQML